MSFSLLFLIVMSLKQEPGDKKPESRKQYSDNNFKKDIRSIKVDNRIIFYLWLNQNWKNSPSYACHVNFMLTLWKVAGLSQTNRAGFVKEGKKIMIVI